MWLARGWCARLHDLFVKKVRLVFLLRVTLVKDLQGILGQLLTDWQYFNGPLQIIVVCFIILVVKLFMRIIPRLLLLGQGHFLLLLRADNFDLRNLDDSKRCVFSL